MAGVNKSREDTASQALPDSVSCWPAMVDAAMAEMIDQRCLPPGLDQAVRYALLGGGKRLRPILAMASAQAMGASPHVALRPAAAVEFVHAFSLVHDDLPAIDNDDLRRGRPTLHKHAGEAMAILAGDALLALAFVVLSDPEMEPKIAARLSHELAVATTQMIAGEAVDTLGEACEPHAADAADRLLNLHRRKTGALIAAACRMGAICAVGAEPSPHHHTNLNAITRYAHDVGLMFQIVDDLLDVEQSSERVGKRTGKDARAGKLTFPGLWGVAHSRAQVERLELSCVAALTPLGPPADTLSALAHHLARRTT